MTESTASDLALALLRLQSVRKGMYSDDPNRPEVVRTIDRLATSIQLMAERAARGA